MATPLIVTLPLNYGDVVCDIVQYSISRYERFENPLILTTTAIKQQFKETNLAAGGSALPFAYPKYSWAVNGNERAFYTASPGGAAYLVGALVSEPDGLTKFELYGYDASNVRHLLMTHWGYLNRSGAAKNDLNTVVQTASRDWETLIQDGFSATYQYAIVPKNVIGTTRAPSLIARLGAPFSTAIPAAQITRVNYVPPTDGVPNTPCITKSGITVTENLQDYAWTYLISNTPRLPLLDGVRGICTTPFTTALHLGREGKVYGANPWQVWVMDATGTKKTLFGIRHKYAPLWTETSLTGPENEYIGTWDASIPATERYAWEPWSIFFDPRTLFPINLAAPIPPGETEHPHTGAGPVMFATDRHGYLLKAQFSAVSHATPAQISRWCGPLADPWGAAYDNGIIYICERGLNRISKWSADTPNTYLGDLIADPTAATLGKVDASTRVWIGAAVATTRAHPIVAPEGMAILDGYLYWGALAQQEVRRMPLAGGPVQVVCRPYVDNNSNYIYIAISDGSFGPRGTIFTTTWSVTNNGRPQAFLPVAGTAADGTQLTHSKAWLWNGYAGRVVQGPGGKWESDTYGSAVAVGRKGSGQPGDPDYGALVCTSAEGDVSKYMLADSTDGPLPNYASVLKGGEIYTRDYQVLHGPFCNGLALPLPWGADPDCDNFMAACGYANNYEDPAVIAELQATIATLTQQINDQQTALDTANGQVTTLTTTNAALTAHLASLGADVDAILAAATKAKADE